ncbi:MAG TPA: DUF4129 domain-containing protein [Chitinophagaceae bacterium]|nr:DUF4129 domain-containing protein [Chitinophagaceae bacterium]
MQIRPDLFADPGGTLCSAGPGRRVALILGWVLVSLLAQARQADTNAAHTDTARTVPYDYYTARQDWDTADIFRTRPVPDSIVRALRREDAFWYASLSRSRRRENAAQSPDGSWVQWLAGQGWYRTLIWIVLVGGFLAALIWFLVLSDVRILRQRARSLSASGQETAEADNIFSLDYPVLLDKAQQAGDYRLATRLLFWQVLTLLTEQKRLRYSPEQTNQAYLDQLASTPLYPAFFRLIRYFEYIWYGGFPVSEEQFRQVKQVFLDFQKQLGRST